MKKKNELNKREYAGGALILSALLMVIIFVITCIKKKNLLAAFAAVAAMDFTVGYFLIKNARKRNNGYMFDLFDGEDYEVFDEDEAANADRTIRASFNKRHSAEARGRNVKPAYEIPVDDEATEEDFVK